MVKKLNDFLAAVPMTAVGGAFLAASLFIILSGSALPSAGLGAFAIPFDPAWVTVFICGFPLLYLAIYRLIKNSGMKKISSALLISIAMIAAIGIGDIFAAAEVAFIMAIGAILEEKTAKRAKKGLHKLISFAPRQGRRMIGGREQVVNVEEIRAGDILRILPGETVPVDGDIISGNTSVNQAVITGESLPVDKEAGDSVFCGSINRFGAVDIRATKVGEDSSLNQLIKMVRDAENKKAPMERIADAWATWLVPVALLIALVTAFVTNDIVRAVTVLVVFCPCALVLATPTAVMAAIGQATKYGLIIKSGEALERMGTVDCLTFDKTGTLTYGNLIVSDVVNFDPALSQESFLKLTASAESKSEHPLAKALASYMKDKKMEIEAIADFIMIPGKGVRAKTRAGEILCGNANWLEELNIVFDGQLSKTLERLRSQGKATIITAIGQKAVGVVAFSDRLRENAAAMIKEVKTMHTDIVLLSGDHIRAAEYFAGQAGITNIQAELLPEEKVKAIIKLQEGGNKVCMIGDGINDAPALKTADVGVAMGTVGSDIAVDAADIVLMGDDISKIPYLKRLANAAVKTIKFSIALSLFINFAAIVLSVRGLLTPTSGALVHNAGSVLVVLIAAFLYDRKFIEDKPQEKQMGREQAKKADERIKGIA